jgi:cytochrome P450
MKSEIKSYQEIPGPKSLFPYLGKLLFKKNYSLLSLMVDLQNTYGDLVRISIPFVPKMLITSDADLTAKILMGTEKNNKKAVFYDRLKIVLGEGLLTSGGAKWRAHRKLMSPLFHPKHLQTFSAISHAESKKNCETIQRSLTSASNVNISEETSRVVLSIVSRFLFSMDLSEGVKELRAMTKQLLEHSNKLFFSPLLLPTWLPTPFNRSLKRMLAYFDRISSQVIKEHRDFPDKYQDLVSDLLKAKDDETLSGFTDQEIKDQIITVLLAGYDTTATAISFGIHRLAREKEVTNKIRAELKEKFVHLSDSEKIEAQLPYLENVIQEILRMYASVWISGRELMEDLVIDSFHIPAKTSIQVSQYLMHRHKKHWDNPSEFNPDRFSQDRLKSRHPFSYFPFGGGARSCIGMHLAKTEMRIYLANFFSNFKVDPIDTEKVQVLPRITMMPKSPIRVLVQYSPVEEGNE